MNIYQAPVFRLKADSELQQAWNKTKADSLVRNKRVQMFETTMNRNGFNLNMDDGQVASPNRGRAYASSDGSADFAFSSPDVLPEMYRDDLVKTRKNGFLAVRKNSKLDKFLKNSEVAQQLLNAISVFTRDDTNTGFMVADLRDELNENGVDYDGLQNVNGRLHVHVSDPDSVKSLLNEKFEPVDYDEYVEAVVNATKNGQIKD